MGTVTLSEVTLGVTREDLELSVIALFALQTILKDASRPDVQFAGLIQLVSANQFFNFNHDLRSLFYLTGPDAGIAAIESLIDKLHGAYDGSL